MSSRRRIRHLASQSGHTSSDALKRLTDAGFKYQTSDDQVARSEVAIVLEILSRSNKSKSPLTPGIRWFQSANSSEQLTALSKDDRKPAIKRIHLRKAKSRRIIRLTLPEVMAIRTRMQETLIARQHAFGATEPLFPDKLAMAVERQNTSGGGIDKYDTVPLVGASLTFGIAMGHAFENGNKRTALVTLLVFLERNKTLLTETTEEDLYQLITTLVKHELPLPPDAKRDADSEVVALANWIDQHSRQLSLGDRLMRFNELRATLEQLGCTFEDPVGNFIKIRNNQWSVKIGYPRPNYEVQVKEVKRVRKALKLDEAHGLDSSGFYNLQGTVDKFVNQYRNLMRRLADL